MRRIQPAIRWGRDEPKVCNDPVLYTPTLLSCCCAPPLVPSLSRGVVQVQHCPPSLSLVHSSLSLALHILNRSYIMGPGSEEIYGSHREATYLAGARREACLIGPHDNISGSYSSLSRPSSRVISQHSYRRTIDIPSMASDTGRQEKCATGTQAEASCEYKIEGNPSIAPGGQMILNDFTQGF